MSWESWSPSPSSCYSGANALYNRAICTALPGLLAHQSKGYRHKDPEFWNRSRLSSWRVQSESNCVWYNELAGTILVASDSGWSSSNLSCPLTTYLSLVSLLSLRAYCQACEMGVIWVIHRKKALRIMLRHFKYSISIHFLWLYYNSFIHKYSADLI